MKKLLLLTLIGCCAGFSCSGHRRSNALSQGMFGSSKLDPHWIYISKDIRWTTPPKEIIEDIGLVYDGSGSLLVLYPSGDLASIRCEFRKNPETGQLSLNGVVSFSVATGRWTRNADGTLTTVAKFCISPMGPDDSNKPPVETRWIVDQSASDRVGGLLTSAQESMVPLPDNFRDVDGIAYMLKFTSRCS